MNESLVVSQGVLYSEELRYYQEPDLIKTKLLLTFFIDSY